MVRQKGKDAAKPSIGTLSAELREFFTCLKLEVVEKVVVFEVRCVIAAVPFIS